MWAALTRHFAGVNSARKLQGIRALATFALDGDSLRDNICRIKALTRNTIAASGSPLHEH